MEAELEATLRSVPVSEWKAKQVLALDWDDGPVMGLCQLDKPECTFRFESMARGYGAKRDERLFEVSEARDSAMEDAFRVLAPLGRPVTPVWVPIWRFDNEEMQRQVQQAIDQILAASIPTPMIVLARGMADFLGFWHRADPVYLSDLRGQVRER